MLRVDGQAVPLILRKGDGGIGFVHASRGAPRQLCTENCVWGVGKGLGLSSSLHWTPSHPNGVPLPSLTSLLPCFCCAPASSYDTTDLAALDYRANTLGCDWLIYVVDSGQKLHFDLVFAGAKRSGLVDADSVRLDHVGFGVVKGASHCVTVPRRARHPLAFFHPPLRAALVLPHSPHVTAACDDAGEDGKRWKTRSGETVRLVDLLDAACSKMRETLRQRKEDVRAPHAPAPRLSARSYRTVQGNGIAASRECVRARLTRWLAPPPRDAPACETGPVQAVGAGAGRSGARSWLRGRQVL